MARERGLHPGQQHRLAYEESHPVQVGEGGEQETEEVASKSAGKYGEGERGDAEDYEDLEGLVRYAGQGNVEASAHHREDLIYIFDTLNGIYYYLLSQANHNNLLQLEY